MTHELHRQLIDSKKDKVANTPLMAVLKIEINILSDKSDSYGPAAANYALRAVASLMKKKLRRLDSCNRAGNELTLIMPMTSAEDGRHAGRRVTEMLRKYLSRAGFETVDINVGVAVLSENEETEILFWNAEEDLKKAKHRARPYDLNRSTL